MDGSDPEHRAGSRWEGVSPVRQDITIVREDPPQGTHMPTY